MFPLFFCDSASYFLFYELLFFYDPFVLFPLFICFHEFPLYALLFLMSLLFSYRYSLVSFHQHALRRDYPELYKVLSNCSLFSPHFSTFYRNVILPALYFFLYCLESVSPYNKKSRILPLLSLPISRWSPSRHALQPHCYPCAPESFHPPLRLILKA